LEATYRLISAAGGARNVNMSMGRSAQWPFIMEIGAMLILPILVRGPRKFAQPLNLCSRKDPLNTMSIGPTAVEVFAGT
jgi:hypothetical protein